MTVRPYSYNDHPTAAEKEAAVAALLATNIPYGYRAAVALQNARHAQVSGNRPSSARTAWQNAAGQVTGYELAVKDLFGFFAWGDAQDVLAAAVEQLETETAAVRQVPVR